MRQETVIRPNEISRIAYIGEDGFRVFELICSMVGKIGTFQLQKEKRDEGFCVGVLIFLKVNSLISKIQ